MTKTDSNDSELPTTPPLTELSEEQLDLVTGGNSATFALIASRYKNAGGNY